MTQDAFAAHFGFSPAAVRDWEQGRRRPEQAARTLLLVIDYNPAVVAEALKGRPEMVHVILTGRNAHPLLVELADTVTEMREVKHAYQKGILAQRGIEY